MNLGDHVGDIPRHVADNRAALRHIIGSRPVFLKQVHGVSVASVNAGTTHGTIADACITTQRGVACTIMAADCLPVLLTDTNGMAVAAVHAGWRGLAGVDVNAKTSKKSVLETAVDAFEALIRPVAQLNSAQAAPEIIAWLGPCIGPDAFEVGAEVKAAFEARQPDSDQFFTVSVQGTYKADLAGLARAQLRALGVTQIYGNDSSGDWCTLGNPLRFFSHRRDTGVGRNDFNTTGRMAACIWLV